MGSALGCSAPGQCPSWVGQNDGGDRLSDTHIFGHARVVYILQRSFNKQPHSCLMAGLSAPAHGKCEQSSQLYDGGFPLDGLLGLPEKRPLLKGNEVSTFKPN